jgi:hypothetical protein
MVRNGAQHRIDLANSGKLIMESAMIVRLTTCFHKANVTEPRLPLESGHRTHSI